LTLWCSLRVRSSSGGRGPQPQVRNPTVAARAQAPVRDAVRRIPPP
jgi:hypothetical protein